MNLTITAYGKPAPQGSKKAFVNKKTGRAIITDDNQAPLKNWRTTVSDAALGAMNFDPFRWDCPIYVHIRFFWPRPASHYGRQNGRPYLKANAPIYCPTKPDKDKLERAVFDALTAAGVYVDDSLVVDGGSQKFYADGPSAELKVPGAVIEVRPIHADDRPLTANEISEQGTLI